MNPGVYDGISNAEYHSGPGASKSFLDLVHRSPMHAKFRREHANDNEPTVAQAIGTAFHTLLLEPELFVTEYTLAMRQSDVPHAIADRDTLVGMVQELNAHRLPKLSTTGTKDELLARIQAAEMEEFGRCSIVTDSCTLQELKAIITNQNARRPGLLPDKGTIAELTQTLRDAGREITLWSEVKAEWLANNGHRIVLDQDAWDQLHAMRDAVLAHPAASALLTAVPGWAERSVYWVDTTTGELCRCRPDFWRQDGIIVDVKTCEDASPEAFAKSVANWRYHVQHPFYLDGINAMREQTGMDIRPARAFVFLAVEKKAPHAVAVYALDHASIELGRVEYRADLDTLHQCNETGAWPGYGDNIKPLSVPRWAFNNNPELLAAS